MEYNRVSQTLQSVSVTLQFLSDQQLKNMIANQAKVIKHDLLGMVSANDLELNVREKNAVRYIAGYVAIILSSESIGSLQKTSCCKRDTVSTSKC